ncbi:sel1 repeat family protein [Aeromonas popoffii]|uniref:Sel1 repeat family protein n=1 Tax=Aeromonas popoffii TaxID=70856 RepID=A0ABS5GW86_9GAMM|nr:tetratricopeptide repeat protein [Aeromonas popoffii]MBR7631322.1 sel1 repeat family protein [Aeromonas popoffii]
MLLTILAIIAVVIGVIHYRLKRVKEEYHGCMNGDPQSIIHHLQQITADPANPKSTDLLSVYLLLLKHASLKQIKEIETLLQPPAEAGALEYQLELGLFYQEKLVLDPDGSKAIHWLEKAAAGYKEQGDDFRFSSAKLTLAYVYSNEARACCDYAKARSYFEDALQPDISLTNWLLGESLTTDKGGPKDLDRAYSLMSEYAETNHYYQFYLGNMFLHGTNFLVDYTKARYWLNKCAETDSELPTSLLLAKLAVLDPQGENDYSNAKAVLEQLAQEWDSEAQYLLGKIHEEGLGIAPHPTKALMYYQLAAMAHQKEHKEAFERCNQQAGFLTKKEGLKMAERFIQEHPITPGRQANHALLEGDALSAMDDKNAQIEQAIEACYIKSAKLGNLDAMNRLMLFYRTDKADKPAKVVVWATLMFKYLEPHDMTSMYQFYYLEQAKARLNEEELAEALHEIATLDGDIAPYAQPA